MSRKNGGVQAHATQTIFAIAVASREGRQNPVWRSSRTQLANRRCVRPNLLHHIGLGDGLPLPGPEASQFRQLKIAKDRQRALAAFFKLLSRGLRQARRLFTGGAGRNWFFVHKTNDVITNFKKGSDHTTPI
jgi:hypothetical protein